MKNIKPKTKKCTQCDKRKYLSKFPVNNTKPGGYDNCCLVCKREMASDWYINNKDRRYELDRKRRARKLGVNEHFTRDDVKYTKKLFKNKCANCGATEKLTIDHHYPLQNGNALTRMNAVVLCKRCNSSKSTKEPYEFYTEAKFHKIENILTGKGRK